MTLAFGMTFTMDRAQVVYRDTYGGTKTVIAKGAMVFVIDVYPGAVALRFEGSMYEVAKSGCYALAMADRSKDFEGWKWDDKKAIHRRPIEGGTASWRCAPRSLSGCSGTRAELLRYAGVRDERNPTRRARVP